MFSRPQSPQREAQKPATWTEKFQRSLARSFFLYGLEGIGPQLGCYSPNFSLLLTVSGLCKRQCMLPCQTLRWTSLHFAGGAESGFLPAAAAASIRTPLPGLNGAFTAQMPECLARKWVKWERLQGSLGSVNKRIAGLAAIQKLLKKRKTTGHAWKLLFMESYFYFHFKFFFVALLIFRKLCLDANY